jgi:hypothetical protein
MWAGLKGDPGEGLLIPDVEGGDVHGISFACVHLQGAGGWRAEHTEGGGGTMISKLALSCVTVPHSHSLAFLCLAQGPRRAQRAAAKPPWAMRWPQAMRHALGPW